MLLHDLVTIDLCCDIRHTIDKLLCGDVVLRSGPLAKFLHLPDGERKKTIRVLEVLIFENTIKKNLVSHR